MLPNTAPLAPASFPDNFSNLEFHSSRLMGRILLDWIRIENSQRSKLKSPELWAEACELLKMKELKFVN